MNAKQLQTEQGEKVSCWYCGVCGRMYQEKEASCSEWCCKCADCGKRIEQTCNVIQSRCDPCDRANRLKREAERLERATLVDWDGPVLIGDDHYYLW